MESDRVVIGALIFIVMVLGANFVLYAVARGATKSGVKSFIEMLGKSLNTSTRPKDDSMDELRRRMEELEKGKKDTGGDSE
jgi:hypothetical protein